ncbi:glutamate receptor ionotropic, delta-1-like [Panulirus ornatus]|uniref:glutamate receptor ionotropic, delta-1-like n=1 Tax=Panulirus ornatus TaxID=150431 RepID=UPI003A8AB7B8
MSAGVAAVVVVEAGSLLSEDQEAHDHLLQALWGGTKTSCSALILDLISSTTDNNNGTHLALRLMKSSGLWQRPETRVVIVGDRATVRDVLLHSSLRNTIHALYLAIQKPVPRTPPLPRSSSRLNKAIHIVIADDSSSLKNLSTLGSSMRFSYEVREEPNRSFGDEKDGVFTGMIGQLQREESDFSTIVAPTPGRLKVVDYLRGYPADMMVVTSLKPALLPAHLALIRPFAGELWLALAVSVVALGVILWLLQKAWRWMSKKRGVRLNTALLYSWGALLEHPPPDPSVSMSGRVLVGWWLVFCLVITTGFRSSLIAHLTVRGRSGTLDSFQDLVEQDGWRWATEPWLYSGAAYEYFSRHTDPVVQEIHSRMEVLPFKEALQQVLSGGFSFISVKNYVTVIVTSSYTDTKGETPFYISNKGFYILACFGWGLRKGAPFYPRFRELMSRLEDAGIIRHWTEEVIARRVREKRQASALDLQAGLGVSDQESSGEVALGLHHLQGAFYLLLVGFSVAFLLTMGENFTHYVSKPQ